MADQEKHLLVGCSFTDPAWQTVTPWSVEYAKTHHSFIVAKAGMGIKGIATEAMYYLRDLSDISTVVIILPTLWRVDIEMDMETYLCNSMVDLLEADNDGWRKHRAAKRKWLTNGGPNSDTKTEQGAIFEFVYKHQGFLVLAKEHFRALKILINHCKERKLKYHMSAIQDPLDQLCGLDYIADDIKDILFDVEYDQWFRFDDQFIDGFLGHQNHPSTKEHQLLCKHVIRNTA